MNFPVVTQRMALINVDMQNIFVDNPKREGKGLPLLERINDFAAVCRAAGILVIHTRGIVRDDGTNVGVFGEIYPPAKEVFNKDAPSAALHPRLVIDERDIILDKPRYGAFYATDLELILRSQGIDTVIITGIATNVCCETTAREAMVRDFRVFFLNDGTLATAPGGLTAEEVHWASLATLGALFAQVLSMDEMIAKIQQASRVV
ncbi:MAG: isochorismatase family cysteine hydrolase [Caldilineaceae bacterium]